MKAIRMHERSGPGALVFEDDVPMPKIKEGDALVRIHACAITPTQFTWKLVLVHTRYCLERSIGVVS